MNCLEGAATCAARGWGRGGGVLGTSAPVLPHSTTGLQEPKDSKSNLAFQVVLKVYLSMWEARINSVCLAVC